MLENTNAWLTVHDVATGMGLELSNDQAWIAGAALAKRWSDIMGTLPLKDLRTKKSGAGSHCFAIYPPHWSGHIEAVVRSVQPGASPQGDLFRE